jgi:insulysin
MNIQSDQRRELQLSRSLSNPEHPFCGFATGDLKTHGGVDVRSKLLEFYESHYSANGLKLVILGRHSLDQLEKWAIELFSNVQNKNSVPNRWDDIPLFLPGQLRMQVFARPIMDFRRLTITFPFLDEYDLYETPPSRYISHLLGYGGSGSISSYLKINGWATGISAGAVPVCPGSALFQIIVALTEKGLIHYQKVVKVIFHYIAIIKERAPEEWVFNEMKKLAEIDYQFGPKLPADRFTSELSRVMLKPLPRKWLLSYRLPRKFDPELTTKALSYLRGDNFRLMIVSQHFPCDAKEKWYETEYKEEKIPEGFLKEIADALVSSRQNRIQALRMPLKNAFIPHDLSAEKIEAIHPASSPELIRYDEDIRIWYKKDDRFGVPKASVYIILRIPLNWTPANYIKAKLYCDLVTDGLDEDLYDAKLAGLSYNAFFSQVGLVFSVKGYNEKLFVLLQKVVSMMHNLTVDPERFVIIKERLTRAYRNAKYQQPFCQVTNLLRLIIEEYMWSNDEYAAEIEHVKANDIETFFPQLLQQNHVEILAHGNLHQEQVLNMAEIVEKSLHGRPLPQSQWHVRRDINIPPGSNYIYNQQLTDPSNVNNCIQYYLCIGSVNDDTLRAKLILLEQICGEPVLNRFRTKEQLGFVIESGVRYSATTMGYFILIQSERATQYLESRINLFLTSFAQTLEDMPNEEFETQKNSATNKLMAKFEDLYDETMSFWEHIQLEDFQFLRRETEATLIRNLTKADVLDFYHQYINPMSKTRMKLSVHMSAHSIVDESTEALETAPTSEPIYIDDVGQFKATLPLGPGPVSFMPVEAFMPLSH